MTSVSDQTAGREIGIAERLAEQLRDLVADDMHVQAVAIVQRLGLDQPTYTALLTLPAAVMEVPEHGPTWQVLDARDEETWHDLTAVVDCELGEQCPVRQAWDGEGDPECVVLVSAAWSEGFAHLDLDDLVSVRIPAEVTR